MGGGADVRKIEVLTGNLANPEKRDRPPRQYLQCREILLNGVFNVNGGGLSVI